MAIEYQIAQKLHVCTDLHIAEHGNFSIHNVIDLHLLPKAYFAASVTPRFKHTCLAVFVAHVHDAMVSNGKCASHLAVLH